MATFALSIPGPGPDRWYLARAASAGNWMRTADPCQAITWPSLVEAVAWLDSLPPERVGPVCGHTLQIVRISFMGEVVRDYRIIDAEAMEKVQEYEESHP